MMHEINKILAKPFKNSTKTYFVKKIIIPTRISFLFCFSFYFLSYYPITLPRSIFPLNRVRLIVSIFNKYRRSKIATRIIYSLVTPQLNICTRPIEYHNQSGRKSGCNLASFLCFMRIVLLYTCLYDI